MTYKRAFDLTVTLLGMIPFIPIMLIILAVKWLWDGRPLFFTQERIGINRRPFTILKICTMQTGTITPFGRLLRSTGLDEVPQFIHVLRGEMSLVGPRPLTQYDIARLDWGGVDTNCRWSVLPGITGAAQVYGGKGAVASLSYDIDYIRHHNIGVDIKYLLLSLIVNAIGKQRMRRYLLLNK